MKKILLVFGTRPEAIKMAPLYKALKEESDIDTRVCVTAQHREMLDQVLRLFNIEPFYDLDVMVKGQALTDLALKILHGLNGIFKEFKPDLVLVHGDTTTSCMAATAAYYNKIKVGHVEAGLRTYDIYSPWPEEGNRLITGVLSNYHFAPTSLSKQNLIKENKSENDILVTGNTVIDALFWILELFDKNLDLKKMVVSSVEQEYKLKRDRKFILVTGHRRENFGEKFINICMSLKRIALKNPNIDIVYPVHLNPNVQNPVREILSEVVNVYLISPQEYMNFVYLMSESYFILTDSGGVQEEAPSLSKPVLVMRDTTERPEALEAGTVKLVGTTEKDIVANVQLLIDDVSAYDRMFNAHNPYGDGSACKRIVDFLKCIDLT